MTATPLLGDIPLTRVQRIEHALDGGFAGWKNAQALTTRGKGFKQESFNYISYERLKTVKPDQLVLYDLRKPAKATARSLTDLNVEFPGLKQAKSRAEVMQKVAGAGTG